MLWKYLGVVIISSDMFLGQPDILEKRLTLQTLYIVTTPILCPLTMKTHHFGLQPRTKRAVFTTQVPKMKSSYATLDQPYVQGWACESWHQLWRHIRDVPIATIIDRQWSPLGIWHMVHNNQYLTYSLNSTFSTDWPLHWRNWREFVNRLLEKRLHEGILLE